MTDGSFISMNGKGVLSFELKHFSRRKLLYFIQLPNISWLPQLARCTRDERYEQTSPFCLCTLQKLEKASERFCSAFVLTVWPTRLMKRR